MASNVILSCYLPAVVLPSVAIQETHFFLLFLNQIHATPKKITCKAKHVKEAVKTDITFILSFFFVGALHFKDSQMDFSVLFL